MLGLLQPKLPNSCSNASLLLRVWSFGSAGVTRHTTGFVMDAPFASERANSLSVIERNNQPGLNTKLVVQQPATAQGQRTSNQKLSCRLRGPLPTPSRRLLAPPPLTPIDFAIAIGECHRHAPCDQQVDRDDQQIDRTNCLFDVCLMLIAVLGPHRRNPRTGPPV